MRSDPRHPLALVALVLTLPLASCEAEGLVFGMPESRFRSLLLDGSIQPFLALDAASLGDPGRLGAEACYYLARWIEDRVQAETDILSTSDAGVGSGSPPKTEIAQRVRLLLRTAYERGNGFAKAEAGRHLVFRLASDAAETELSQHPSQASSALWAELIDFAAEFRRDMGIEYAVEKSLLPAYEARGRDADILGSIDFLRSSFPAEASADEDALLYYEGTAAHRRGKDSWSIPIRSLLFERPANPWIGRALGYVEAMEAESQEFTPGELGAARMRVLVEARNYGPAKAEQRKASALTFSPYASPSLVADAAKAYLYSGAPEEGEERLAELETRSEAVTLEGNSPTASRPDLVAWTSVFYRARFLRARGELGKAASAFRRAAATAPSPLDRDAALWYGAECAIRAAREEAASGMASKPKAEATAIAEREARRLALSALLEASRSWSDPSRFFDLVDSLFREALRARDWSLIDALARELAPRSVPSMAAKLSYVVARALELGYLGGSVPTGSATGSATGSVPTGSVPTGSATGSVPTGSVPPEQEANSKAPPPADSAERPESAASSFKAILDSPSAPLYYRVLAAWRLGARPTFLPPELTIQRSGPAQSPLENFILGFLNFGLEDLAWKEAVARSKSLDLDSLRRLGQAFLEIGRADVCMRLVSIMVERPDWDPRRSDYELLYPRSFLGEIRDKSARAGLPEHLVLGLVRSESYFRAAVSSSAGAIGLTQLMPSTAAEMARSLQMEEFDLRSPADNIRLGTAYFAKLLEATGKPIRAMMAYNAGPTRLRRWISDIGELPDDLLLEAIGYEETRQYGRNILEAAVLYGELYYGEPAVDTAGMILGTNSY